MKRYAMQCLSRGCKAQAAPYDVYCWRCREYHDTPLQREREAIDTYCDLVLTAFVLALAWFVAGDWARALVLP